MKTKIARIIICIAAAALGAAGCNVKNAPLPPAQGREGEILAVVGKSLWTGALRDSLRSALCDTVDVLPAPEPRFDLLQQPELSGYMQKFRNVVIVNIDPGYDDAMLTRKDDVYARDQLIFTLNAPSAEAAAACIGRNKETMRTTFLDKDRASYTEYYRKIMSQQIADRLRAKFGIDICVPREYSLDVEDKNFVWMAREEGEKQWGLLLWADPYTDESQLTPETLVARMNGITRRYVTGKDSGSYMTHQPLFPPVTSAFEEDGMYRVQINGLWRMENGFMGGPYISLTTVDARAGKIITGMGFVFYPNREKRQYIRQLEAILHTIRPAAEEE